MPPDINLLCLSLEGTAFKLIYIYYDSHGATVKNVECRYGEDAKLYLVFFAAF